MLIVSMALAGGEHHPDRFQLLWAQLRGQFIWNFLGANLLDKITALVITQVYACNQLPAVVMEKVFDREATFVVIGCSSVSHTEDPHPREYQVRWISHTFTEPRKPKRSRSAMT